MKAAIIGGGVIGGGWAARFLLNGWDVQVYDPDPQAERKIGEVLATGPGKLLDSGDRLAMYGACEAIANLGERAGGAAPKLRALLAGDDPWMLTLAVNALAMMDEATRKAAEVEEIAE